MSNKASLSLFALLCCVPLNAAKVSTPQSWIAQNGQPRAVIIAPNDTFHQFVARELQRYFEKLSGANLEIKSPESDRTIGKDISFIVIGDPSSNPLVKEAAGKKLIALDGLKKDGFVLKTVRSAGRNILFAAGNDEASSMYAAYGLLEQCGAMFRITGDILPARSGNLPLKDLDLRREPAFATRGFDVSSIYESRAIMSLADQHKLIDQMAKMRFNFLMIDWMAWEPWLKHQFNGETKLLGDVAKKESGYMLWDRDYTGYMTFGSHLTSDMEVGKEHFQKAGIYPRMAAPEFQHVENSEQAFDVAKNYLRDVIAYAKSKKIHVWVSIDATTAPPNLARFTSRTMELPFNPIFGTATCPNDPASLAINEGQFKSLLETYPEAEGYFLYITEAYPVCKSTAADREFYRELRPQYQGEAEARRLFTGGLARNDDEAIDSNAGSVYFIQKLVEARDRFAPKVKLGIAGIGRLYLWPFIDKLFPSDMPFADFESSAVWTPTGVPMEMFGLMKSGRPALLINRAEDDASMLGMQFDVNLYYRDRVLEGGLKYGLAGFSTQLNRQRGTEQNTSYMAEGEWEPHLTPDQFYKRYTEKIFGEQALEPILRAFRVLEQNEEFLGWDGYKNFGCCGSPPELEIAYRYSQQPNLFDGPKFPGWDSFLQLASDRIEYFSKSIELLNESVRQFHAAQPLVNPVSQKELLYLINKTEAYRMHLETIIAWDRAYLDLDRVFQMDSVKNREIFLKALDQTLEEFKATHQKGLEMANRWSELIDDPSDLGVLYRINVFTITGTDVTQALIQNIDNFHHGRDYMSTVDFSKVAVSSPRLSSVH